jgi:hypothetical protein
MATAKDTNVLYLLNALYTSGFASMSPTVPRLTSTGLQLLINLQISGRTMHTLYAISFIIYSSSSFIDWVHTYAVLRGSVTSFPLEDWFVVAMVGISVTSSMLTMLLLVSGGEVLKELMVMFRFFVWRMRLLIGWVWIETNGRNYWYEERPLLSWT